MKKKILKIEKDPLITSGCWTYYKMAILQTCENFDEWLSGNLHLFLDQNGNALFGENGSMYPLSFFFDILEVKNVDILTIPSEEICDFIIKQVENDSYVLMDLNYEKLRDEFSEKLLIHETLIYGYDKSAGTFKTPILTKDLFKEANISFNVVKKAYQDALDYYRADSNRLYNRRAWFYGITIIKPKTNYFNSNAFYDLICKLRFQLNGDVYTRRRFIETGILGNEYTYYYTGVSALCYFSQLLK